MIINFFNNCFQEIIIVNLTKLKFIIKIVNIKRLSIQVLPLYKRIKPMKSMTGYGKSECCLPGKKITVEIKSVNSKQLDLNIKMPGNFREKEIEIRSRLADKLERGKIDFYINSELLYENNDFSINLDAAKKHYSGLVRLSEEINLDLPQDVFSILVKMPDVLKQTEDFPEETEWETILQKIDEAMELLDLCREKEGNVLKQDMLIRINNILDIQKKTDFLETERVETIKQRIAQNLQSLTSPEKIDNNRLEQEMIYYLEKIDFTEEKIRLQKHCAYFIETSEEKSSNGKKLGFILQEIGREINTLGSKANHSEIQKLVVEMKDELEKIKEQSLNIL